MTRRTVRVFCGKDVTTEDRQNLIALAAQINPNMRLIFNRSGVCELAIVLNFDPGIHWVLCPEGGVIKWLLEPVVKSGLSRRFSISHSRKYSRVFTSDPVSISGNEVVSPPLYPPRLSRAFVRLLLESPNQPIAKTKHASMITSSLSDLPGHIYRQKLLAEISVRGDANVDVFGRGINPIAAKEEGLLDYHFSLVVENSNSEYYWSEKVSDAFLCETVPIYVGARKLGEYFPEGSFIQITDAAPSKVLDLISSLGPNDYEMRREKVLRAKELCLKTYNLPMALSGLLEMQPHDLAQSFVLTCDGNTLVHWFLKLVSPALKFMVRLRRHVSSW